MVDFQLDEMQEMLRDLAHEFAVDEVRPHAEHWDADEVYPIDAIRAAHEMGLLNLHIPESYGGPGLGCQEDQVQRNQHGAFPPPEPVIGAHEEQRDADGKDGCGNNQARRDGPTCSGNLQRVHQRSEPNGQGRVGDVDHWRGLC